MKRWLLAGAVLLGGAVGLSHADYVIIVANLSGARQGGNQGQPGGMQPPGVGGGGFQPPGTGQPGGGLQPPGPNVGGGGGFQPPRPGAGNLGGPPPMPGGGNLGGPPPMPGGGNIGGGNTGSPDGVGGARGGFGNLGGAPPMPGGGFGMGGMGGLGETFVQEAMEPIYVVAVVETQPMSYNQLVAIEKGPLPQVPFVQITHKWGTTLLIQGPSPQIVIKALPMLEGGKAYNPHASFEARLKEAKSAGPLSADKYRELAEWALSHNLTKEFDQTVADALKDHKDDPTFTTVAKVQEALAKGLPEGKDVGEWQAKLRLGGARAAPSPGGHYVLLHNAPKNDVPEVAGKLTRLEDSFRRYYLWFALHGKPLPLPEGKLVAVLPAKEEDFQIQHEAFDSVPLVSDGFVARRDNLLVFAPTRTDQQYGVLKEFLRAKLQDVPDTSVFFKGQGAPAMQTVMLMRKALENESDITTASREGSRQLLAASGLLPRNVVLPEWVQFGTASFFETPRGLPWATVAGSGVTLVDQTNYLTTYKKWQKDAKRGASRDDLKKDLVKVVTDQYFRQIPKEKDDEKDADRIARTAATKQAHTLAWSLTYFLMNSKLDKMQAYFNELAALPRDLEFDDDVLLLTFAKAFDCVDKKTNEVNQQKLAQLAKEWDDYLKDTPVDQALKETADRVEAAKKTIKNAIVNPQQGGGQPGVPGGFPGAPGGAPGGAPPGAGGAGGGAGNPM